MTNLDAISKVEHDVAKVEKDVTKLEQDVAKVAQVNDVDNRTHRDVITKEFGKLQHAGNGQLDAATTEAASFMTIVQAIFAEGTDYTKKSVETRLIFVEKLLGAKSLATVIQIQSEYAKTSYAAFVAQATKMGELHLDLLKVGLKPTELAIAKVQGTK